MDIVSNDSGKEPESLCHEEPSNYRDFAFVSSGNAQEDDRIRRDIIRRDRLIAEGMCPNGCGKMVTPRPNRWECPVCRFTQVTVGLCSGS